MDFLVAHWQPIAKGVAVAMALVAVAYVLWCLLSAAYLDRKCALLRMAREKGSECPRVQSPGCAPAADGLALILEKLARHDADVSEAFAKGEAYGREQMHRRVRELEARVDAIAPAKAVAAHDPVRDVMRSGIPAHGMTVVCDLCKSVAIVGGTCGECRTARPEPITLKRATEAAAKYFDRTTEPQSLFVPADSSKPMRVAVPGPQFRVGQYVRATGYPDYAGLNDALARVEGIDGAGLVVNLGDKNNVTLPADRFEPAVPRKGELWEKRKCAACIARAERLTAGMNVHVDLEDMSSSGPFEHTGVLLFGDDLKLEHGCLVPVNFGRG